MSLAGMGRAFAPGKWNCNELKSVPALEKFAGPMVGVSARKPVRCSWGLPALLARNFDSRMSSVRLVGPRQNWQSRMRRFPGPEFRW